MEIFIKVYSEDIPACKKQKTHHAFFTFVAVDAKGHPVKVPELVPSTPEEQELFDGALRRRQMRLVFANRMDPKDALEVQALFNFQDTSKETNE